MSEMGNEFESVATKMADAQSLWDATMVSQTSTYSTLVSNCIKFKEYIDEEGCGFSQPVFSHQLMT